MWKPEASAGVRDAGAPVITSRFNSGQYAVGALGEPLTEKVMIARNRRAAWTVSARWRHEALTVGSKRAAVEVAHVWLSERAAPTAPRKPRER